MDFQRLYQSRVRKRLIFHALGVLVGLTGAALIAIGAVSIVAGVKGAADDVLVDMGRTEEQVRPLEIPYADTQPAADSTPKPRYNAFGRYWWCLVVGIPVFLIGAFFIRIGRLFR